MQIPEKNAGYVDIQIDVKSANLQKAILMLGKNEQEILKDVDWSPLLNPEKVFYYKAEDVAATLGKGWTAVKVNETLREMKYHFRFKNDYFPTPEGVRSGCFHRLIYLDKRENSTAFSFSIMWTVDIIDRINEYLKQKAESEE